MTSRHHTSTMAGNLIASVAGGYLFDHWLRTGPFVFFGMISAAVMIWALLLRSRSGSRGDAEAAQLVERTAQ